MKSLRIMLLIATAVLSDARGQTPSLEPFEVWERARPKWASDITEVAYAAVRCGALYGVIGQWFENYSAKPEEKQRGADITGRGAMLVIFGNQLAGSVGVGMSSENQQRRMTALLETYQQVVCNRSLSGVIA